MRRVVRIVNGKKYLVTVPSYDDYGAEGLAGFLDSAGSGSTPSSPPIFIPVIATQSPTTSSAKSGSTLTLTVNAGPSGPFDYIAFNWQTGSLNLVDGSHYTGSQTNTLTIYSISSSQAGMYDVIVTNQYGVITSSFFDVLVS